MSNTWCWRKGAAGWYSAAVPTRGVCNIAAWLRPDVLIGGFHLREDADPALVEQVGRRLLELGGIYYTCHCTSQGAYARLKDIMGEKLRRLRAGDVAEI